MGLKKPIKTGSDLPTLNELVGVDVAPVETDGYIVLDTVPGQACALESNTPISIKAELGKFGDATAADVASGKTFTSAAGLKVAGTLIPAQGKFETMTGSLGVAKSMRITGLSANGVFYGSTTYGKFLIVIDQGETDVLSYPAIYKSCSAKYSSGTLIITLAASNNVTLSWTFYKVV